MIQYLVQSLLQLLPFSPPPLLSKSNTQHFGSLITFCAQASVKESRSSSDVCRPLVVADKESKLTFLKLLPGPVDSGFSPSSIFLFHFYNQPSWRWSILEAQVAINSLPESLWPLHRFLPATAADLIIGITLFPVLTLHLLGGRELHRRPFRSPPEKPRTLRPLQHHRHSTAIP